MNNENLIPDWLAVIKIEEEEKIRRGRIRQY